jgi:hypothetical protein
MEDLIEAIRLALADGATDQAKTAGADACRMILTALEPKPADSMAEPVAEPLLPVAQIVGAMRGLQPEQLLDLAIARLRAALPAGTAVPAVEPLKFNLVPVPARVGPKR